MARFEPLTEEAFSPGPENDSIAAQKLTAHFGLCSDAAAEKVAQYWELPKKKKSDF